MHWKYTVKPENSRNIVLKLCVYWTIGSNITTFGGQPFHTFDGTIDHFLSWGTLKAAEETFVGPGQTKLTLWAHGKRCNNNHHKHMFKVFLFQVEMILAYVWNYMFAGIWQLCMIISWLFYVVVSGWISLKNEEVQHAFIWEEVARNLRQANLGTSNTASSRMKVLHIHKSSFCWPKHSLSR